MQINFIGHGLDNDKKLNVGDQIATSFESKLYDKFFGFVAFAATSGIGKILKSIDKAKATYSQLIFFVGVDNKGTSKEALEMLLNKNIDTYIYHRPEDFITYHPKLFLFEGAKYSRVIIGSSNMTRSGFLTNIEASIQLDFQPSTDKQGNKLLTEIKDYFKEILNLDSKHLIKLDKELIEKYQSNGLLYSQFASKENKEIENQPTDENTFETENYVINEIEFGQGLLPKQRKRSESEITLGFKDLENFDYFLEQYVIYKTNINPAGIVRDNYEDRQLVNWYDRIKLLIRNEQLPDDFAKRLDEVGFPLGDGKYANSAWKWELNYQKLLKYMKDKNLSYAYVPQHKNKTHPDYELGGWFARQKLRKKGLVTPPFLKGEFEKLEAVNFKWESVSAGGNPDDETWIDFYFQLEEFWKNPSNKNQVPKQTTPLGKWLNDQITNYNNKTKKNAKGELLKLLPIRAKYIEDLCGQEIWNWQHNKRRRILEEQIEAYLEFRKVYPTEIPAIGDNRFKKVIEWKSQTRYRYKGDTSKENKWRMDILNSDRVKFPW